MIIVILTINIIAFLLMGIDKKKAKDSKYRIPERTLFILAIVGGSIGAICGMYVFHHKTKHKKFTVGLPIILIFQIIVVVLANI